MLDIVSKLVKIVMTVIEQEMKEQIKPPAVNIYVFVASAGCTMKQVLNLTGN